MLGTLSPSARAREELIWGSHDEDELSDEENQWEAVVEEIIKYG